MIRVKRAISDMLISVAALTVLLVVIVSVNDQARDQVSFHLSEGRARQDLRTLAANARHYGSVAVEAARHHSIQHAPLVFLVLAGSVLVGFMLKV